MIRSLVLSVLVLCLATAASADNKWGISYVIAIPDGDTQDYIGDTSWRGFGLEWRWSTESERPFTLGISLTWQVFHERLTGTQQLENGAVTGIQDRYLNSFPLMFTSHYYLGRDGGVQFFLGGGAGALAAIQRVHLGVNVLEETNWHFAVAPEVGLFIPFNHDVRGMVSVKYNYAFEAGTYIGGDKRDWQYFSVNLGLMWIYW